MPALLDVRNLSKRFGDFHALDDVGFSVRAGEILGLIGPNGSGKTTLFQCVAGVMPVDRGAVLAGGTAVHAEHRKDTLHFVPDGIRPWPDQTVDWTLRFAGDLACATTTDRETIARAIGIEHLLRSRMATLSKGEHKRVLLAIGLLSTQPLLMLDEPFDGLDVRQTRDAMDVLRHHANEGRTLFLSIHQLVDAARICDRFVLLSGGRTVGEGTLDELRTTAGIDVASNTPLEEVFLALT